MDESCLCGIFLSAFDMRVAYVLAVEPAVGRIRSSLRGSEREASQQGSAPGPYVRAERFMRHLLRRALVELLLVGVTYRPWPRGSPQRAANIGRAGGSRR